MRQNSPLPELLMDFKDFKDRKGSDDSGAGGHYEHHGHHGRIGLSGAGWAHGARDVGVDRDERHPVVRLDPAFISTEVHEKMLEVAKLQCDVDAPNHNIEWAEEKASGTFWSSCFYHVHNFGIQYYGKMEIVNYSKSLVEYLFLTAWTLMFRF